MSPCVSDGSATDEGSAGTERAGDNTGDGLHAPLDGLADGGFTGVTTPPSSSSIDPSSGSGGGASTMYVAAGDEFRSRRFSSMRALSSASGSAPASTFCESSAYAPSSAS